MKKIYLTAAFFLAFTTTKAQAHCEIPCGIYDDAARFEELFEHSRTIEKSMSEINELSNSEKIDYHSISRWTINKEKHAEKSQSIASQYFLTQRVKCVAYTLFVYKYVIPFIHTHFLGAVFFSTGI